MGHTKGPWVFKRDLNLIQDKFNVTVCENVACAPFRKPLHTPTTDANAALICAAPELLDIARA